MIFKIHRNEMYYLIIYIILNLKSISFIGKSTVFVKVFREKKIACKFARNNIKYKRSYK